MNGATEPEQTRSKWHLVKVSSIFDRHIPCLLGLPDPTLPFPEKKETGIVLSKCGFIEWYQDLRIYKNHWEVW